MVVPGAEDEIGRLPSLVYNFSTRSWGSLDADLRQGCTVWQPPPPITRQALEAVAIKGRGSHEREAWETCPHLLLGAAAWQITPSIEFSAIEHMVVVLVVRPCPSPAPRPLRPRTRIADAVDRCSASLSTSRTWRTRRMSGAWAAAFWRRTCAATPRACPTRCTWCSARSPSGLATAGRRSAIRARLAARASRSTTSHWAAACTRASSLPSAPGSSAATGGGRTRAHRCSRGTRTASSRSSWSRRWPVESPVSLALLRRAWPRPPLLLRRRPPRRRRSNSSQQPRPPRQQHSNSSQQQRHSNSSQRRLVAHPGA